ncbi:hypothetical protein FGU71_05135 [Erythrobacter insulae]|uniref:PAS domain-containing protein n=1 Tax=Erythrobacter insulae TaxID=2584124 RepID=A0A547PAY1_9SPHN|nr:hypothetical protein FGU71_05135 [Erythrobacter insulae]
MDNLRGTFDSSNPVGDDQDWDAHDEDVARELPPQAIGQDERRMQVRAYNHWASLLGDNTFPSIEDLEPHNLDDFGPNSVLLDFSVGIEDPAVQFLGHTLAQECGTDGSIKQLSDVPPRSLLSRITDHYMQILANQAPIGFEAEFVNQRGSSIMYRGILLPFSSNDETIDFIYGVINWKEIADQVTSDELLLEIDQALELDEEPVEDEDEPQKHHADPFVAAPSADIFELGADAEVGKADPGETEGLEAGSDDNVASLGSDQDAGYSSPTDENDLPVPDFGQYSLDDPDEDEEDEDEEELGAGYSFASLSDYLETPVKKAIDLDAEHFDASDYQAEYREDQPENANPEAAYYSALSDEPVDEDMPAEPKAKQPLDLSRFAEPQDIAEPDEGPVEHDVNTENEEAAQQPAEEPAEETAPQPATEDAVPEEPVAELQVPIAAASDDFVPDHVMDDDTAGLYDFLASARELAQAANVTEDRSRAALYAAVGRAYDFSLAAKASPQEYSELLEDSGLSVQERAPMTPVVKLVFGSNYDKTRLTEYAAVLAHAHRIDLDRGALAEFLEDADGGLKGVVAAERRLRREESGKSVEPADEVRRALAKKLRELEELTFEALSGDGAEFSLVVVRRDGDGGVAMIGEIDDDIPMIERAAKKLVG